MTVAGPHNQKVLKLQNKKSLLLTELTCYLQPGQPQKRRQRTVCPPPPWPRHPQSRSVDQTMPVITPLIPLTTLDDKKMLPLLLLLRLEWQYLFCRNRSPSIKRIPPFGRSHGIVCAGPKESFDHVISHLSPSSSSSVLLNAAIWHRVSQMMCIHTNIRTSHSTVCYYKELNDDM